MPGKIMHIGFGGVAKATLQIMVTKPEIKKIVVASRDTQSSMGFCNLIAAGALAQGLSPEIEFTFFDLNHLEQAAEIISRENPDIIFSTATMMSPWLTGKLPLEINMTLYPAGFGVWLPMHLPLTMKLMKAVRMADFRGFTLTSPFPDIVNYMVSKINLTPTSGIGNVDLYIPKIRRLSADALGVPVTEVHVQMVAHHALMPYKYEVNIRVRIFGFDPDLPDKVQVIVYLMHVSAGNRNCPCQEKPSPVSVISDTFLHPGEECQKSCIKGIL